MLLVETTNGVIFLERAFQFFCRRGFPERQVYVSTSATHVQLERRLLSKIDKSRSRVVVNRARFA